MVKEMIAGLIRQLATHMKEASEIPLTDKGKAKFLQATHAAKLTVKIINIDALEELISFKSKLAVRRSDPDQDAGYIKHVEDGLNRNLTIIPYLKYIVPAINSLQNVTCNEKVDEVKQRYFKELSLAFNALADMIEQSPDEDMDTDQVINLINSLEQKAKK